MTETIGDNGFVENKIADLKKRLSDYENNVGIRTREDNKSAEQYLVLTKEQLQKMTAEECGYIAYELVQFSIHVQKNINKELAIVNFCRENIKRTIANDLPQIKAYHFEEKKMLAIRHNSHADILHKIEIQAQARVDTLSFITDKIKLLVEVLKNIQYTKKGTKYE